MADEQDTAPTAKEIAAARETLRKAEALTADAPRQAMLDLVALPEFATTEAAMIKAQGLNPANTELSYAISMFNRMKTQFTPA